MLLVKVVPRGGMGKLIRAWRGPFTITEVRQQGRYYILGEGIVAHYERIKPYHQRPAQQFHEYMRQQHAFYASYNDEEQEKANVQEIPPSPYIEEHDDSDETYDSDADSEGFMSDSDVDPQDRFYGDMQLRTLRPVDYGRIDKASFGVYEIVERASVRFVGVTEKQLGRMCEENVEWVEPKVIPPKRLLQKKKCGDRRLNALEEEDLPVETLVQTVLKRRYDQIERDSRDVCMIEGIPDSWETLDGVPAKDSVCRYMSRERRQQPTWSKCVQYEHGDFCERKGH